MNYLVKHRQGKSKNPDSSMGTVGELMEVTVTQIRSRLREKNREIGKQIRLARKLKSWSLNRLAEQIGVSYQQLQKYEKGENRVSASMLLEISRLLTLPLSFFYAEPENTQELHPTFEELQTAFQIHAIKDQSIKFFLLTLAKRFSTSDGTS